MYYGHFIILENFSLFPQKTIRKFWDNVDRRTADECWPWTGHLDMHGYGKLRVDKKMWLASRVSHLIHKGIINQDLYVLHSCDNPVCVNPAHLRQGTPQENVDDCFTRGRRPRAKPPKPLTKQWRKLTDAQVDEIRRDYKPGVLGYKMLAKRYGVDRAAIYKVVKGVNHKR